MLGFWVFTLKKAGKNQQFKPPLDAEVLYTKIAGVFYGKICSFGAC